MIISKEGWKVFTLKSVAINTEQVEFVPEAPTKTTRRGFFPLQPCLTGQRGLNIDELTFQILLGTRANLGSPPDGNVVVT